MLRIESLVVDARQRRGGTGRALTAAAEQLARAWGCLQIEVTSLRSRADAHAFYRRLGYTDVCDRSGRMIKETYAHAWRAIAMSEQPARRQGRVSAGRQLYPVSEPA